MPHSVIIFADLKASMALHCHFNQNATIMVLHFLDSKYKGRKYNIPFGKCFRYPFRKKLPLCYRHLMLPLCLYAYVRNGMSNVDRWHNILLMNYVLINSTDYDGGSVFIIFQSIAHI